MTREPQQPARDAVPPHNLAAEEQVIAEALYSPIGRATVRELLTSADFYGPAHGHIFEAVCHLDDQGDEVSEISVSDELGRQGVEDVTLGDLVALRANALGTDSYARTHARIVAEQAKRRRALAVGHELATAAMDPTKSAEVVVREAEAALVAVEAERRGAEVVPLGEAAGIVVEQARTRATQGGTWPVGLPTGWPDLDQLLGGMKPGNLVLGGGRPSMGKTSFGVGVATWDSLRLDTPTLYVSAEMSRDEISRRALALVADVPLRALQEGRLSEAQIAKLERTQTAMDSAPIKIMDKAAPTVGEVRIAARAMKAKHGLGLVVVDYLQLLTPDAKQDRAELETGQVAWGLKTLARDLDCVVLALAQLNRGCEARTDKRPVLSDLRDSGRLEQDADVVMFIYRDEVYNPSSPDRGIAEVIVAKHRNGPTGTRRLAWLPTVARFGDLAREPAW